MGCYGSKSDRMGCYGSKTDPDFDGKAATGDATAPAKQDETNKEQKPAAISDIGQAEKVVSEQVEAPTAQKAPVSESVEGTTATATAATAASEAAKTEEEVAPPKKEEMPAPEPKPKVAASPVRDRGNTATECPEEFHEELENEFQASAHISGARMDDERIMRADQITNPKTPRGEVTQALTI